MRPTQPRHSRHAGWNATRTLLILTATALVMASCLRRDNPADILAEAERDFQSGRYDRAKIEYLRLTRMPDAETDTAMQRLATIAIRQGALLEALPYLLRSVADSPADPELRAELARIYLEYGDLDKARAQASAMLETDSANDAGGMLLVLSARTAEDAARARQTVGPAEPDKRPLTATALAILELREGRPDAAISAVDSVITAHPHLADALLARAEILLATGRQDAALDAFQDAAAAAPARSAARMRHAGLLLSLGRHDEAAAAYEHVTAEAPDYLPAWLGLVRNALALGKLENARRALDTVFGHDPGNIEGRLLEASLFVAQNDRQRARQALEALDANNPGVPLIKLRLAEAALATGDANLASSALSQALALAPDYHEAILLQARLDLQSGNADRATGALRTLQQRRPDLPEAKRLLASALETRGDLSDAQRLLEELVAANPKDAQAQFALGMLLRRQGRMEPAAEAFQAALQQSPNDDSILFQLIDMDLIGKNFDSAHRRVDAFLAKGPERWSVHFLKARVLAAQNRFREAEAALEQSLRLKPDSPSAYELLIAILLAEGRTADAVQRLENFLEKQPDAVPQRITLALLLQDQGRHQDAADHYRRILEVQPAFAPALNNLAWLLSKHLNQAAAARELARKAYEQDRDNPAYADTYGWALLQSGSIAESLPLLEQAAAAVPAARDIQAHYAQAAFLMGRTDASQGAATQALEGLQDGAVIDEDLKLSRVLRAVLASEDLPLSEADVAAAAALAQANPNTPAAQAAHGAAMERAGRSAEAAKIYEALLKTHPDALMPQLQLAQLYAGPLNEPERAGVFARKVRELAPGNPAVATILAESAYASGDFAWAYNLLRQNAADAVDPRFLTAFAKAAYAMGHIDEARNAMSKVTSADATDFLSLTAPQASPMDPSLAALAARRLTQDPQDLPALVFQAGNALAGAQPDAVQRFQAIVQQFPEFSPAKVRLASLLSANPDTITQAATLAESVRRTKPEDAQAAALLARIKTLEGDHAYAVTLFEEARRNSNLSPEDELRFAQSLLATDQKERARDVLTDIHSQDLPEPLREDLQTLLKNLTESK